jgi:hypothetical protein
MTIRAYVHADKGKMWELGEKHGLTGDALLMFRHALTELVITLEVIPETGVASIVAVDGIPVPNIPS